MIGINHLGWLGRLGNQMFQYAALRGIAAHKGYEFCIPPSNFRNEWKDHQLLEAFKLEGLEHIEFIGFSFRPERHFDFDEDLFENMPDAHNLYGYLQTERYFSHIADEIRKDFQFKDEVFAPCKEVIESIEYPIALHVRRGDYVNNVKYPACTREYYDEALSRFDPERPVVVFSDDPEWCLEEFSDARFLISERRDNVSDLCMMSLCSAHIIANSSFSWWGAWLANSETVYAPKRWFGATEGTESHDPKDLIPERWTRI